MKYIKEQPFLDRKGHQALIQSNNDNVFEPTLKWVLHLIVDAYIPSKDFKLSTSEIRKQWKILDILEEEKMLGEYFVFEDEDFALMKKIINYFAPIMLLKAIVNNAPVLEDILENALDKLPTEES